MSTAYVDASVIVRIILDEPDPLLALRDFDTRLTSVLTEVECLRAVETAWMDRRLDEDAYIARRAEVYVQLRRMHRLELSRIILERAGHPLPTPLKTLDALHLMTAREWRDRRDADLVFATHDRRLGQVAAAVGFDVIGV